MPNYAVAAGNKDETVGYSANNTGSQMVAQYSTALGDVSSLGRAYIDTSPIGTDTITAADLFWYHTSYTKSKLTTYSRLISINGVGILNSSATPAAAGWHSQALDATAIAAINKTGESIIIFDVDNANPYDRAWSIRAWNHVPTGVSACYLRVTHAPAGGPTRFSILR